MGRKEEAGIREYKEGGKRAYVDEYQDVRMSERNHWSGFGFWMY
jgi:hypothetical protein